jgi:hypothetical protein
MEPKSIALPLGYTPNNINKHQNLREAGFEPTSLGHEPNELTITLLPFNLK